jgi:hypothetical protein
MLSKRSFIFSDILCQVTEGNLLPGLMPEISSAGSSFRSQTEPQLLLYTTVVAFHLFCAVYCKFPLRIRPLAGTKWVSGERGAFLAVLNRLEDSICGLD